MKLRPHGSEWARAMRKPVLNIGVGGEQRGAGGRALLTLPLRKKKEALSHEKNLRDMCLGCSFRHPPVSPNRCKHTRIDARRGARAGAATRRAGALILGFGERDRLAETEKESESLYFLRQHEKSVATKKNLVASSLLLSPSRSLSRRARSLPSKRLTSSAVTKSPLHGKTSKEK